ncbi:MAG: DUF2490 domain-containing protein [Flavipsychrobacter sp.]
MKKLLIITLTVFASMSTPAIAQTVTYGNTNTWFLLMNRFYLSDKFTISNELHERTGAFLHDQATFIFRPSVDYSLNNNTEVSVGYSYVRSTPYLPYSLQIPINEHNIWEQILLKFNAGKVHIMNRIRFEHRFIDNVVVYYPNVNPLSRVEGTKYANRFRFRFNLSFDLAKINKGKHTIFVNAFDEAWINQSDNLMPTNMGRNWIYTGLGYKFNKDFNIQLAHLHQYDRVGNNNYISSSIIQLSLFKNFTLYKSKAVTEQ